MQKMQKRAQVGTASQKDGVAVKAFGAPDLRSKENGIKPFADQSGL